MVNSADSRFCGRCGASLPPASPPVRVPLAGILSRESITESARGLVSVLTSVLGAVGLGMVAEFLVKFVAARVAPCACGCLILAGLLICIVAAGLIQAVPFR
jgi:hypothetical protein